MFIRFHKTKGQNTLEYGILITIVVGALLAMSVYMKRGIQGRFRQSTDDIGEQYSPGYTTGTFTTTSNSTTVENLTTAGVTTTNVTEGLSNRTGNESIEGFSNESWW